MPIISIISLVILLLTIFLHAALHKLRNNPPPSPPLLPFPIIGHLYLLPRRRPLYRSLADVSRRWGPLLYLRLGSLPVVLVSGPAASEECLTKNDVVSANRPRFLAGKYIGYDYTSLEWAPYGDHWRNLRRMATLHVLSSHRLKLLAGLRSDVVREFIRRLFKDSSQSENHIVEMKSAFFRLTLNNLMKMIIGSGGGVEETEAVSGYRGRVERSFVGGAAYDAGDLVPLLRWFRGGGVASFEEKIKKLHREDDEFVQELIDGCRRMKKKKKEFGDGEEEKRNEGIIDVLLSIQESDLEYYTDDLLKSFLLTLLSTGTGTTAGTLEWALSLLLNNPQVLNKAQAEIKHLIGTNHLLSESDLKNLPYLHSITKETLRMYPAGPLNFHVASSDCKLQGYRVPKGTTFVYNLWAIQNDPGIWDEPRSFKPERFEGVEGNRVGYEMMPFGSGRRSCPGEGLAMVMVQLALGSLIQCFEWERVGEEMVEMAEGFSFACAKLNPLQAKCRPRQEMIGLLSAI